MREWNETRPQGTDWETVERGKTALREIEIGRAPEMQWELECYSEAFVRVILRAGR